jgi:hypothetical protein
MGKHSDQQSAARQFYADAPRPRSAREECEELCDEPVARLRDEWAEKLVGRGVARLLAQQCAGAVVDIMQERDAAVARQAGYGRPGGGGEGAAAALFSGLFARAVEQIVEAKNSKFSAGCLLLAMGNQTFARSARHWAEIRGLSHELAANGVEDWQVRLGLPRTSGQKSVKALASYKTSNGRINDESGITKTA